MDVAETEVRFLEVAQNELKADLLDLLDQLKSESDEEHQLHKANEALVSELQKLNDGLSEIDNNGLVKLQNEVIPALQQQLENVLARSQVRIFKAINYFL